MTVSPLSRILLLGSAALLSGCVTTSDTSAPVVFRGSNPDGVSAAPQPAVAVATPAVNAAGIVDRGGYRAAIVREGDTLDTVAARVGVPTAELASYNGFTFGFEPAPGTEIVLPPRADRYANVGTSQPAASETGFSLELAAAAIDRAAPVETGTLAPSATATPLPATPPAATSSAAAPIRHTVTSGETLFSIARLYNTPVTVIAEWNNIGADFTVVPGQTLQIPVGVQATTAAPVARPTVVDVTPPAAEIPAVPGQTQAITPPPSAAEPLPEDIAVVEETPASPALDQFGSNTVVSDARFSRPVNGPIVRGYTPANGPNRNEGIDIGASVGTPVSAAGDGEVVTVSRSIGELGTIVMVRHPDNLVTIYGRIENVSVSRGDRVTRGQSLGTVASCTSPDSASCSTPSVHFQVRRGMQHTDPEQFL